MKRSVDCTSVLARARPGEDQWPWARLIEDETMDPRQEFSRVLMQEVHAKMSEKIKVELEAGVILLSGLMLVAVMGTSLGSVLLFVLFPLSILIAPGMRSDHHQQPGEAAESKPSPAAARRAPTKTPAPAS
ncbi:MAG: hypothetical protein ACYDGR_06775 [Candidatus Dormibacteria bacterium]